MERAFSKAWRACSSGTNAPSRLVSLVATRSVKPMGRSRQSTSDMKWEIPPAGGLVACGGRPQTGGKCGADFSAEVGSDVSSGWSKKCMT